MAAKIISNESTAVTTTSGTTLYTVPTDKAARIRVEWTLEGPHGAGYQFGWQIGTPNSEVTLQVYPVDNANDVWSGSVAESTPNPLLSIIVAPQGSMKKLAGLDISATTTGSEWLSMPFPADYFLIAGDTVKFHFEASASAEDLYVRCVGVEDDA
jgi:hypothetical protein